MVVRIAKLIVAFQLWVSAPMWGPESISSRGAWSLVNRRPPLTLGELERS